MSHSSRFYSSFAVALLIVTATLLFGACQWPRTAQKNTNEASSDTLTNVNTGGEEKPGDTTNTSVTVPTVNTNTAPANTNSAADNKTKGSTTKTFALIASQWKFDPVEIRVKEGDTVVLNITSVDVAHGVGLPAFGVDVTVPAGETVTAKFVASKKGTYKFFCNVFCGSGHSEMTGTLVVD